MHTAVETTDTTLLEQSSHKLRSASANLGCTTLSSLCKELELMGRSEITPEALQKVLQVEALYETVKVALEKEREDS